MVRSSTRGAQRRSNPCLRRCAMDSFASLAMTEKPTAHNHADPIRRRQIFLLDPDL